MPQQKQELIDRDPLMYKLSICIPTYNRAAHLANCLESIISNRVKSNIDFQVCVSDNCSTDDTENVVRRAQERLPIKYKKNSANLGLARNFLNVVEMSEGEYVWIIGDDDLLMPDALNEIVTLLVNHQNVDYFYINSNHMTMEYVFSFPQPFDTKNLPKCMTPFSSWTQSGEVKFMDLVNPKISFDFLGGMFLSVFRRQNWLQNTHVLDETAILSPDIFSHFDNTFPHIKIFSKAFSNSRACFSAKPLSVCLTGAREWAPMYPLVRSVRLVEALIEYRKNGLSYINYIKCKNYALKYFITDLVLMFINKDKSGFVYIKPLKLILNNFMYPNFYLSFVNYFFRKLKHVLTKWRVLPETST